MLAGFLQTLSQRRARAHTGRLENQGPAKRIDRLGMAIELAECHTEIVVGRRRRRHEPCRLIKPIRRTPMIATGIRYHRELEYRDRIAWLPREYLAISCFRLFTASCG